MKWLRALKAWWPVMSDQTEIRQDGLLYIDREKAVRANLESLKQMVRPGNVR